MASLKVLRRRIASVKNMQKVTRAMKLVSAAKLRRAQKAAESTRAYAEAIDEVIHRLAARADAKAHPLLRAREIKTINLIVVTSDRGLAGAYNGNVLRAADAYLRAAKNRGQTVHVTAIGKRARDNPKLKAHRLDFITDIGTGLSYGTAELLAERVIPRFLASEARDVTGDRVADSVEEIQEALARGEYGEAVEPAGADVMGDVEARSAGGPAPTAGGKPLVPVDAVVVIYTRFKSALSQVVTTQQILPMEPAAQGETAGEAAGTAIDYKYEPDQKSLLSHLLPRHVRMQLFRALLESVASEHGARMTAMESASKNCADMINRLTLQMSRARQAVITTELMEIVSGKEALES